MDVFGGAPRFLAYPRPVVVQSGTDAVLKCQIGGDPRPAVIWERNNEKIDPQGRYRVFEDGNVYNLIITAVTIEDSGQYICKAKNSIGETYAAATLKVEGEAQEMELREENKPRFLIKPLSTRAGRGEDAVFSCKIWGSPKPDVIWEKDGKKLSEIFESTHFSVGSQDGGWFQLKIFKTRAPDGGVYTCKARNEFGEALAGAVLLVDAGPGHEDEANRNGYTNGHWKPVPGRCGRPAPNRLNNDTMTKTAKVKMFAVTEGKHAKFRCFVTGKPKPEIIWRKDGRLILSGRRYLLYEDREGYFTLKVLYCKQKDNGVYVCAASNTAGQTLSAVHLSVKEPPVRFKQPLIDLEVWERDLAVLECEVPEDSVPITWYLEDRRLQPGAKYGMEQWGTKRRLTIRDIGVDDDGIYLCEMPDGGRSIAEVAVKGTIVRKLPRKVDVLEGENAAFCVEVDKEEMDIHWYKDGVELRETHQTILKSFGRTHILVFVNTNPQDTGQVMFLVGRSKTSSQLRVKAARHCPPSAPVGVQINTERANAALLSWIPAQDSRKNPPSGYVLERQEVGTGSQEWLQCLTTDSATSVEILGDSVPCEADYRFRICSVNKYGKSNNVEFPRTVHLVPVARIQAPLQDALVPEGQDALFSIELTASVIGTWFLNGTQIQEDERFSTRRTRTHQSLRIRGVRDTDNGAEITFIAYGIRDSAALYIQAPLVKFSPLSEMDRNKFVEIGNPIVLYCELSDPAAPVHWYKNGVELQTTEGLHIQSEGTMRRIVIQSAEFSHSGVYCCDAIDDVIRFNVEVEAPPVRFSAIPEAKRCKKVHCGRPLLLQCEVSEPSAQVHWYKDGAKLPTQSGLDVVSEALLRTLVIHSAEMYHSGLYTCKTKGDSITFSVDVTAPAVTFASLSEEARCCSVPVGGSIELRCVVSDPGAPVRWFHDDTELGPDSGCETQADGTTRILSVQSAEMCHSGVYTCTTDDDAVEFTVEIQAIPAPTVFERMRSLEAVRPLELECEVADSAVSICWFKDELLPKQNTVLEETKDRDRRNLIVPSPERLHSGLNSSETSEGTVHASVEHKAPSLSPSPTIGVLKTQMVEELCSMESCETMEPADQSSAQVPKLSKSETEVADVKRTLIIEPTSPSNSGSYYCATAEDVVQQIVKNQAEKTYPLEGPGSIVQQFEISDPVAKAVWFKDGTQIYPQRECQSEALRQNCSQQHCTPVSCGSGQVESPIQTYLPARTYSPVLPLSPVISCSPGQTSSNGQSPTPVVCQNPIQLHSIALAPSPALSCHPVQSPCSSALRAVVCETSDRLTPAQKTKEQSHCVDSEIDEAPPNTVEVKAPAARPMDPERDMPRVKEGPEEIHNSEIPVTNITPEHSRTWSTLPFTLHSALRSMTDVFSMEKLDKLFLGITSESISTTFGTSLPLQSMAKTVLKEQLVGSLGDSRTLVTELNDLSKGHTDRAQTTVCGALVNSTDQCGPHKVRALSQESGEDFIYFTQHRVSPQEDRSPTGTVQSNELQQASFKPISLVLPTQKHQSSVAAMQESHTNLFKHYSTETLSEHLQQNLYTSNDQQYPHTAAALQENFDSGFRGMRRDFLSQTESTLEAEGLLQKDLDSVQAQSEQFLNISHSAPVHLQHFLNTTVSSVQEDLQRAVPFSTPEERNRNVRTAAGMSSVNQCQSRTSFQNIFQTADTCVNLNDHCALDIKNLSTDKVHLEKDAAFSGSSPLKAMEPNSCFSEAQCSIHSIPYSQIQHYSTHGVVGDSSQFVYGLPEQNYCPEWPPFQSPQKTAAGTGLYQDKDHTNVCYVTPQRLFSEQTEACQMEQAGIRHTAQTEACHIEQTENQHMEQIKVHHTEQTEARHMIQIQTAHMGKTEALEQHGDRHMEQIETHHTEQTEARHKEQIDARRVEQSETGQTTDSCDLEEFYFSKIFTDRGIDRVAANKVADEARLFRITALGATQRSCDAGEAIELLCEVSDPKEPVTWHKDGVKLCEGDHQPQIQSDGSNRWLTISSAAPEHSGEYSCHTASESVQFTVNVKAPLCKFSALSEAEQRRTVMEGSPLALQCELSDASGQVTWYKDGAALLPESGVDIQTEGHKRSVYVPSAERQHSGVYRCESKDDDIQFTVDIRDVKPKVTFLELRDTDRRHQVQEGSPVVLQCQLNQEPSSEVSWSKDGEKVHPDDNTDIQEQGLVRTLTIHSAEPWHSGVYQCSTNEDKVQFEVAIKGRVPHILPIALSDTHKLVSLGSPIVLQCQVSEPGAQVSWAKDQVELFSKTGLDMKREGCLRKLMIHSAKPCDAGMYSCSLGNNTVMFSVHVQAFPVRFSQLPEVARNKFVEAGCPIVLQCEVSEAEALVLWNKDGQLLPPQGKLDGHMPLRGELDGQMLPQGEYELQSTDRLRALVIQAAKVRHSGLYSCEAAYDSINFKVDVAEADASTGAQGQSAGDQGLSTEAPGLCTEAPGLSTEAPGLSTEAPGQCGVSPGQSIGRSSHTPDVKSHQLNTNTLKTHLLKSHTPVPLQCCASRRTQHTALPVFSETQTAKTSVSKDQSVSLIEAPPVSFTEMSEEDLLKNVVEQEELVLSCEVSAPEGAVMWYRDGVEIQPSDSILIQAEGTKRSLTIFSAQLSDSGTFSCRTGDNVLLFKVTVREPPVMIVHPKEDVHLDRHVPEEVILSCELSRANGTVSWFKDGQKLQETENIRLKVEGPYRRLKILSSRVEDSGEYVCDTDDDSIFFQLNITEPPVRIVSPSQSQMELCQQTAERMVLSCEISRSNAVVRWYRNGLEVEENQNLLIEEDGVYRRLIIPKTTVQDSAEYVCDTADDSMTFFVNIAEPPVRFVRPRKTASKVEKAVGESVVLDCEVSRVSAEVTWKRNGEEVEESKNISLLEEGVSRQLTIHSVTPEDAGQYVCDAKDDLMDFTVTVREPPVRIIGKPEGRTEKQFVVSDDIILVCELSRANAAVTWSKDGCPIEDSERVCSEEQGVFRSLVVLSAELDDSGQYSCDTGDDCMSFYITVKEPPVKIVGNSGAPEHHLLLAGEDLVLECEVSRPDAQVQWLRNGEVLQPDERVQMESFDVVRKFVLSNLQPSDSGEYICDTTDDKMIMIVEVQAPPATFINKPPSPCTLTAFEGESLTLSAKLSREQNVRWLKDGGLLNAENIHISSSGPTQNLTLHPLQLSDSGEYVCEAPNDHMCFSVLVKEMKVKFVRTLVNTVALKGQSLTLQCEVNKAKGDVQWLKDGQEVVVCRKFTIRAHGRERSFTIHEVSAEDGGVYSCESTDDRTSATVTVEAPRVVEFIAGLRNVTVREGEDAVFKCVVSPEDTELVWQINGRPPPSQRTTASKNGTCHTLRLSHCAVTDSGRVTANAEGQVSHAELHVQEQQVVFTRQMRAVTAEEFGEALLEVEVSQDSGEVQWMRQGVLLHAGPKYSLLKTGRIHSLRVLTLALSDSGRYSCETLHDRTQAQLTVQPRKISIKKGLSDIRTTERETASFEVHLSHPDLVGTWFRNGTQLKPSTHFRISSKNLVHSLTICNLSVEDTGTFMFSVENLKTTARLVVKEPPVTIFRKLEDQRFPEGAIISIECELSRHNVDVKWMKNGVEVKPSKALRIYAMGRKRFLQVMKCKVSDSGVYSCDAGDATTSCSVEVYERELLILQELEDLEIEEDQNAVFMCELSVEDIPGEWFKRGERIQPTSTVKIRQEGTKHFLLMCNVRPEDSGEVKFVARHVESVAFLDVEELPVNIVKPLQDKTVLEKTRVLLDCMVSTPRCSCRWYKGVNVILPSERFEICSEGCIRKLIIQQVALEDEGTYSVQVGEHSCSAKLTVEAQSVSLVRGLSDLEVVAPGEACFEVEVSVPVQGAPVWTLNGVPLQPGPWVLMEKMGTVHRLTFRQTSAETSGDVEFISGKTRSSARLSVITDPE